MGAALREEGLIRKACTERRCRNVPYALLPDYETCVGEYSFRFHRIPFGTMGRSLVRTEVQGNEDGEISGLAGPIGKKAFRMTSTRGKA